jgi:serine phosphatase RsbU (regulator of sigma subunit)
VSGLWRSVHDMLFRDAGGAGGAAASGDAGAVTFVPTLAEDPLAHPVLWVGEPVDAHDLPGATPLVRSLRDSDVELVVPLAVNGEVLGLLTLGPRLSGQPYSAEDRRLLAGFAAQAAPALRMAQLFREQQRESAERQRLAQELRLAQLIQQRFLPEELPQPDGWELAAHYQPAREVGGDFYDVICLPEGRIGLVVGDVTDKGVPAALVMASTRSILRAAARDLHAPGEVLARANDSLAGEMPPGMFVTCLYAVLDPACGLLRIANAGHCLPIVGTEREPHRLRARGMPLGLMPGMEYEEVETLLLPGECVLLYSDGIIEAHDEARQMFGTARVQELMGCGADGPALITRLLEAVAGFSGALEQEDDITLLSVRWGQATGLAAEDAGGATEDTAGATEDTAGALLDPTPARP